MPLRTLQYERRQPREPAFPWWQINAGPLLATVGVVFAVNACLVWAADTGWGVFPWIFLYIPLANATLAALGLLFAPSIRRISGTLARAHAWFTAACCASAITVDAIILINRPHSGC